MTRGGMQVLFVFTSVPHSRRNDFSDYVFSFRLSRGKHVPPEVLILNVYDKLKEILSDGILVLIVTNTLTVRYRPTPARHPSFCESHGDETSPKSLHRLHEAFLWRIVWKETAANGWHSGQNIPPSSIFVVVSPVFSHLYQWQHHQLRLCNYNNKIRRMM